MQPELAPWIDLDEKAVAIARGLAMDAVQKVGNGHPGTAMSLAPVAYTLFQRFLRHDPKDPNWIARDRFILSCGHSSLTLYIQLLFSGYGLTLDDLKAFRTWGSLTPGHPEYGHTLGVETTTGPLGQGVANAVGMAMAARYERGLLDPDTPKGESVFDHNIWVICSDGDLQEGVSAEASSLAGVQELGSLKVIYDDNRISIEGDTHYAFTREELWCILRDLWTEQKFNVILVTHDLRESVFLADTVYVMSKSPGRFVVKKEIDLPRPRDLEVTYTPEFTHIVHELRGHIGAMRKTGAVINQ